MALFSVIALGLVFGLTADNFFSNLALSNIVTFSVILGIIVLGIAVLMISGEFDLSVGSAFAVVGFAYAILLTEGVNPWVASGIAVGVGALLGAINGVFVVGSGNPSFVITLGMLLGYRGVARAIGGGTVVSYQPEEAPFLFDLLNSGIISLNNLSDFAGNWRTSIIWFLVIATVMAVILHRSKFGNWIFSTGGNPEAATAQGVPSKRVKFISFVIVGVLVGISGVISFAERRSIDPWLGLYGAVCGCRLCDRRVAFEGWLWNGRGSSVGNINDFYAETRVGPAGVFRRIFSGGFWYRVDINSGFKSIFRPSEQLKAVSCVVHCS